MFSAALVIFLIQPVFTSRILCYYPIPSISHQIVYRELTRNLANRGHELVVITPVPYFKDVKNVREIDISAGNAVFKRMMSKLSRADGDTIANMHGIAFTASYATLREQMENVEVKELIANATDKFDLVIVEAVFRPVFLLAQRFKAPVVGVSSMTGFRFNYAAVGAPNDPILYPNWYQEEIIQTTIAEKIRTIYNDWRDQREFEKSTEEENAIGKKYFGDIPDIRELANNLDLLLLNVHPIWDGVRPSPPSIVYVGGLHLQKPAPLPQDLKSYLDNCTQGVVYMSLGSNIKSSALLPDTIEIFKIVFSRLSYCILWKWELDTMEEKPENVKISPWLPQGDLLAHPNILVFITQGGLQSADEAIDREVPLIGIPFFADQKTNVNKFLHHGIGVTVDIHSITEDILYDAIITVINDTKYRENIKRLKRLMYDQPNTSAERAVWWIEYIIRHGTGKHLHSPRTGNIVLGVSHSVLVVVVIALASLVWQLYVLVQYIYRTLSGSKFKQD